MRKTLPCVKCGKPAASFIPPDLGGSTGFAMKKMLGALGMASIQVENFMDPDALALTFALECMDCSAPQDSRVLPLFPGDDHA